MSDFSLSAAFMIDTFDHELILVINVKITRLTGIFPLRALRDFVRATDGALIVDAFKTTISPNQKEINALFTTDAFTVFTGPVNIEFGSGNEVFETFENFDPGDIAALNPAFAGIPATTADNTWLQNH